VSQDPTLVRAGQYLHRAGLLRGLHQRHPRRHHVPRPLRETGLLFEYSLYFPRAGLGLRIVFIYINGSTRPFSLTAGGAGPMCSSAHSPK
jgi:hypothetical protein